MKGDQGDFAVDLSAAKPYVQKHDKFHPFIRFKALTQYWI